MHVAHQMMPLLHRVAVVLQIKRCERQKCKQERQGCNTYLLDTAVCSVTSASKLSIMSIGLPTQHSALRYLSQDRQWCITLGLFREFPEAGNKGNFPPALCSPFSNSPSSQGWFYLPSKTLEAMAAHIPHPVEISRKSPKEPNTGWQCC